MNNALTVLKQIRAAGVGVFLAGIDRIRLEFQGELPPWVQPKLIANKPNLLRILRSESFVGRHVIRIESYRPGRSGDLHHAFVFDDEPFFPMTMTGSLSRLKRASA